MTVIGAGNPIQIIIALLIVLLNMLAVLKLGPFVDEADDWLSFLTSFQMLMTLLGGLILKMQETSEADSKFDSDTIGVILIVINCIGFFALAISLLILHPKIRKCVNKCSESGTKGEEVCPPGEEISTKVVPVSPSTTPGERGDGESTGGLAKNFWEKDLDSDSVGQKEKLEVSKTSLGSVERSVVQLLENENLSEEAGKRIAVAHMMCIEGTIALEDLLDLLHMWKDNGQMTEKEFEHLSKIYTLEMQAIASNHPL